MAYKTLEIGTKFDFRQVDFFIKGPLTKSMKDVIDKKAETMNPELSRIR